MENATLKIYAFVLLLVAATAATTEARQQTSPPAPAQPPQIQAPQTQFPPTQAPTPADVDLPGVMDNLQEELFAAVVRLPIAAALGAVLALRPRRKGTPARQPAVV